MKKADAITSFSRKTPKLYETQKKSKLKSWPGISLFEILTWQSSNGFVPVNVIKTTFGPMLESSMYIGFHEAHSWSGLSDVNEVTTLVVFYWITCGSPSTTEHQLGLRAGGKVHWVTSRLGSTLLFWCLGDQQEGCVEITVTGIAGGEKFVFFQCFVWSSVEPQHSPCPASWLLGVPGQHSVCIHRLWWTRPKWEWAPSLAFSARCILNK